MVVDGALARSAARVRAAGQACQCDLPEGPLPIAGDPWQLTQVVQRLLENASRFSPIAARIALAVRTRAGSIELTVRDEGAGIAPDQLEAIFELPREPRSGEGLGISLFLARAWVQAHGGHLTARSDGAGAGSEFLMQLPRPP